jgi:hypothetical protein
VFFQFSLDFTGGTGGMAHMIYTYTTYIMWYSVTTRVSVRNAHMTNVVYMIHDCIRYSKSQDKSNQVKSHTTPDFTSFSSLGEIG